MLEIAVVGGGVHGTFLSHALTQETALDRDEIRVIDSYEEPLYKWNKNTHATGMRFLRSPSSHNMDVDFHALRDFARRQGERYSAAFREPYARPSLPLFQAHVKDLFDQHRLGELRRRGTVRDIELFEDRARLTTETETLEARSVVLAPGHSEHPFLPPWARQWPAVSPASGCGVTAASASAGARQSRPNPDGGLQGGGGAGRPDTVPLAHVFGEAFTPAFTDGSEQPVVVGGGLSGCQLALATAERLGRPVTLVARHPLKVTHFDSNPCYIGPKCLRDFLELQEPAERREKIRQERNPGTVPWDVFEDMQQAIRDGRIRFVVDEVADLRGSGASRLRLALSQSGQALSTDRLVLATGFERRPPAEGLVEKLARRYGLPRGPKGYPVPDSALRWHPRLFVIGALGELELGPACLNIIGAHHAARRIVSLLKTGAPSEAPWTPLAHMKG